MQYDSRKAPYQLTALCLAMAAASSAQSASSCLAGQFDDGDGSGCRDASPGFFVDVDGAEEQTPASPGSFVALAGQKAATLAPPGHFVSGFGATTSTEAVAGTFVDTVGASVAKLAPVGRYVDSAGATTAIDAPVGTYVPTTGAIAPIDAPAGTFVDSAGQSAPTQAPVGSFVAVKGAAAATPCPTNSVSFGGSVACRDAGSGPGPNIVGPEFGSSLGSPTDLGELNPGEAGTLAFDVFNLSTDLGFADPLTDLTLIDATFSGPDGGIFSLGGFSPGHVISEGLNLSLLLNFTPTSLGPFATDLTFFTDQGAGLGGDGADFTFSFSGTALQPVPAPPSLILMCLGLLGIGAGSRTRRSSWFKSVFGGR